jgi:hypothetical protein
LQRNGQNQVQSRAYNQQQTNHQEKMKSDYSFKPVAFHGVRVYTHDPVAAAVRGSTKNRVTIRLSAEIVKKCAFKEGDLLTPFVDMEHRAVLLLSDQRPVPSSARKLWGKGTAGTALEVEFPRVDDLADLFPVSSMRGMTLREASHGRIVFTVPKLAGK